VNLDQLNIFSMEIQLVIVILDMLAVEIGNPAQLIHNVTLKNVSSTSMSLKTCVQHVLPVLLTHLVMMPLLVIQLVLRLSVRRMSMSSSIHVWSVQKVSGTKLMTMPRLKTRIVSLLHAPTENLNSLHGHSLNVNVIQDTMVVANGIHITQKHSQNVLHAQPVMNATAKKPHLLRNVKLEHMLKKVLLPVLSVLLVDLVLWMVHHLLMKDVKSVLMDTIRKKKDKLNVSHVGMVSTPVRTTLNVLALRVDIMVVTWMMKETWWMILNNGMNWTCMMLSVNVKQVTIVVVVL
jgi:hypothetical protein